MCFEGFEGDGPEPYEDDLQTFSDNEAWQDAQAEMREGSELHVATITITAADAAEANRLLALGHQEPDSKECSTLMEWTARFPDGCEADIKVCNGDSGPWVDTVLVDKDGSELCCGEPGEGPIEGEFYFWVDGETYRVVVAVEGAPCPAMA